MDRFIVCIFGNFTAKEYGKKYKKKKKRKILVNFIKKNSKKAKNQLLKKS